MLLRPTGLMGYLSSGAILSWDMLVCLFACRYEDYPVTDVLQMIGRANRPMHDQEGTFCYYRSRNCVCWGGGRGGWMWDNDREVHSMYMCMSVYLCSGSSLYKWEASPPPPPPPPHTTHTHFLYCFSYNLNVCERVFAISVFVFVFPTFHRYRSEYSFSSWINIAILFCFFNIVLVSFSFLN